MCLHLVLVILLFLIIRVVDGVDGRLGLLRLVIILIVFLVVIVVVIRRGMRILVRVKLLFPLAQQRAELLSLRLGVRLKLCKIKVNIRGKDAYGASASARKVSAIMHATQ